MTPEVLVASEFSQKKTNPEKKLEQIQFVETLGKTGQ